MPIQKIVIERGSLSRIGQVMNELGLGKKCLIVEDPITREIAGLQARKALERAGYSVAEGTVEKANTQNAERIVAQLQGCDFSVAVGGGSPIDVAKIATFERGIPFVSVLTAPSHDGIASPIVSITQNQAKSSLQAAPPVAVIADLEILAKAPIRMMSAGFGDVLAKSTSLKDWELGRDEKAEYYCERAARLASQAVVDLSGSSEADPEEKITSLVEALLNCGVSMILAGSSRPASGSEHLFSHFLDRNLTKPAMHGEQCGLGAILMARYHQKHNPNWWKPSQYQWQNIKRMLQSVNVNLTLGGLGVSKELANRALVEASRVRPERYTILHKKPPTPLEANTLLEETSII